jgi:hypothetical protein
LQAEQLEKQVEAKDSLILQMKEELEQMKTSMTDLTVNCQRVCHCAGP